jgi:uncharacterized Zn finger protein
MANISRTWWGARFLTALESCTDAGRLRRGRSYAGPSRLLEFQIDGNTIRSTIRGNVNPYFGVYNEPRYTIEIRLAQIRAKEWKAIIKRLTGNAGWVSRLLLGEVPEDIDRAFPKTGHSLLPHSSSELQTDCSCPDWANPCKHVAGTYYHAARLMDKNPFLLFQLRGLTREALQKELVKSPLGKALASQILEEQAPVPEPMANRFPPAPLEQARTSMSYKQFWNGKRLPQEHHDKEEAGIPALILRREGDNPPFWPRDNSFIAAMSEIYRRVQSKSKDRM